MSDEPEWILGNLPPHRWSSDEAVAYEVALEAINEVLGCYTALIVERPDDPAVEEWRAARQHHAEVSRSLVPGDHARIAEVRASYSALARQLRER